MSECKNNACAKHFPSVDEFLRFSSDDVREFNLHGEKQPRSRLLQRTVSLVPFFQWGKFLRITSLYIYFILGFNHQSLKSKVLIPCFQQIFFRICPFIYYYFFSLPLSNYPPFLLSFIPLTVAGMRCNTGTIFLHIRFHA